MGFCPYQLFWEVAFICSVVIVVIICVCKGGEGRRREREREEEEDKMEDEEDVGSMLGECYNSGQFLHGYVSWLL